MKDQEFMFFISQTDILEYMYERLLEAGYVPEENEIEDISEFMYDYIIDLFTMLGVEGQEIEEGESEE